MFRETDDFGVDIKDRNIVIVQKDGGKEAGRAEVPAAHVDLLKQWITDAVNDINRAHRRQ